MLAILAQQPTVCAVELFAWQSGMGRGWPFSAEEELDWAASLPKPNGAEPTRHDVTSALLAVREGASVENMLTVAPGLSLRNVSAGWMLLSKRFDQSLHAWETILANPSPAVVVDLAPISSQVAPIPTARILSALMHGTAAAARTAVRIEARVAEAQEVVAAVEKTMSSASVPTAMRLGSTLFAPYAENALWAEPDFVPTRPGQLCPMRVRALLHEDSTSAVGVW